MLPFSNTELWKKVFRKPEPSYGEYQCPECGYDRELEENTWICSHCGFSELR